MDQALRALNRFGLGARIGQRRSLSDPRGWLRDQLDGAVAEVRDVPSISEIMGVLSDLREAQQSRDRERIQEVQRRVQGVANREVRAMLTSRIESTRPFVERLVAFWSNHLCVSVAPKRQVAALAGHYERTVIRPHVLGSLADMVTASAKHPAMLLYLDNAQSVGPTSPVGRRTARRNRARGLNENYARELLELHTVGVDGGYTQADVEELAKILTGWSVSGLGPGASVSEGLGFGFRPAMHEPGRKTVLGKTYEQGGVLEGERAIRDLCAHPSTARFLAAKLVRHFVADEAPPRAVAEIEAVFRNSGGDLRQVSLALIDLEEAWDSTNRKFRTPQDWLVSVLRAVGVDEAPQQAGPLLRQLRHQAWAPQAPKGFGDTTREWADPDSLMNRAELARSLAGRLVRSRVDDARQLLDVVDVEPGDPLTELLSDGSIPTQERFALAIGGPAFQWR